MVPVEEKIVTIERLAFGGDGVGRVEGKVVFVPRTAPGDEVRVRFTESGSRFDRGEVAAILKPSPERVVPRCSVFGVCGGCQWQHLDYPAQLKAKETILRETLERIGKIKDPPLQPILPSPEPWNYRHRVQLRRDKGKIGYQEAGTHTVVEFENCETAHPLINKAVLRLKENGAETPSAFEVFLENGEVCRRPLEGPERVFSQVNPSLNGRLVEQVTDFVFGREEPAFSRKRLVVELYSGSGNFTFPLAARAGQVFAVEKSRPALHKAEEEARLRKITNIEFVCGSAEWGLKTVHRRRLPVDTLILDPPRQGAKEILDLIAVVRPRLLIYVSCDPSTLARDLQFLVARHFTLETVQPLDMFPQTYHIETVSRLLRKNGG